MRIEQIEWAESGAESEMESEMESEAEFEVESEGKSEKPGFPGKDVEELVAACRRAEPLTLSVPEDGDGFLFAWEEDGERDGEGEGKGEPSSRLSACLVYCRAQEDEWECYAFTRPERRRQGIFGRLLEELNATVGREEERLGREISLLFLSDGKSRDGMAAAKALNMEFRYAEHRMELELKHRNKKFLDSCPDVELETEETGEEERKEIIEGELGESAEGAARNEEQEEIRVFYGYLPEDDYSVGTCRILDYGGLRYYLYHVEIREDLRGRGLGKGLLSAVFSALPPEGTVILQVSSGNKTALNLYEKAGFRITETLSYYRYSCRQ